VPCESFGDKGFGKTIEKLVVGHGPGFTFAVAGGSLKGLPSSLNQNHVTSNYN
jgi:hypothetical protein